MRNGVTIILLLLSGIIINGIYSEGMRTEFDDNSVISKDKSSKKDDLRLSPLYNTQKSSRDPYSSSKQIINPAELNNTVPSKLETIFEYNLIKTIQLGVWVNSLAWSPDRTVLASGSRDLRLRIWNTTDWSLIASPKNHSDAITFLKWSPDGKLLATASFDFSVIIWNTTTWLPIQILEQHTKWVYGVDWSHDGNFLVTGSGDMSVIVWNSTTWLPVATLNAHTNWITHVVFSPDDSLIASSSIDKTIILWNTTDWSIHNVLLAHLSAVLTVEWSPDGSLFASGSVDFSLIIWNTTSWSPFKTLTPYGNAVSSISWGGEGKLLVAGSFDSQILIWNTTNWEIIQKISDNIDSIMSVSLNDNNQALVSGSMDNWILIYYLTNFKFEKLDDAVVLNNILLRVQFSNELRKITYRWDDNPENEIINDEIITPSDFGWHDLSINVSGNYYDYTFYITANLTDFDQDGLPNNFEEQFNLNLYFDDSMLDFDNDDVINLDEYSLGLDPSNADSDSDGLSDGDEINLYNTDPSMIDTDSDSLNDGDELHVYFTDPLSRDTDADGLLDGDEVNNYGTNPNSEDTDSDEMPDKWELDNGLNPLESSDALQDNDGDSLLNSEEYKFGSDPNNEDSDGDNMSDGYEVKHNLNPSKSNKGRDSDHDLIPDVFEHKIGTDPSNPREIIIIILFLLGLIYSIIITKRRSTKRNKEAIILGYVDFNQRKEVIKLGFDNLADKERAEKIGFLYKAAEIITNNYGYTNSVDLKASILNEIELIRVKVNNEIQNNFIEEIENSTSPINLRETENKIRYYLNDVIQHKDNLSKFSEILEKYISLEKNAKAKIFVNFDITQVSTLEREIRRDLDIVFEFSNTLTNSLKTQKQWFEPWEAILSLIQMTEDGLPVELKTIAEVVNFPILQVELLLKLLLDGNPLIGNYDEVQKIYEKGVKIEEYISEMMDKMKALESDDNQ